VDLITFDSAEEVFLLRGLFKTVYACAHVRVVLLCFRNYVRSRILKELGEFRFREVRLG
jgi:hypothetical protein